MAIEEGRVLYDMDFSSPHHAVGMAPSTGGGPWPRHHLTELVFGDPRIQESVCGLTSQPLVLSLERRHLPYKVERGRHQQVRLELGTEYARYRIELEICLDSTGAPEETFSGNFMLSLDTPKAHFIQFQPDGDIHVLNRNFVGTYQSETPLKITIDIDARRGTCRVSKDGTLLAETDLIVERFDGIRLCLHGAWNNHVGIDNVRIVGEGRLSDHE
jgi:hypothetical protein